MTSHRDKTGRTEPTDEDPQEQGSTHLPSSQDRTRDHDPGDGDGGGQVSEGGGGSMNEETAVGGADAVPDTPDVNK